jgi:hypothetical protein
LVHPPRYQQHAHWMTQIVRRANKITEKEYAQLG